MEREEISGVEKKTSKIEVFSVDPAQINGDQVTYERSLTSAHTIDHDSWRQVGLLLVTSFNSGYILSFSNLMIVSLGWVWGVVCLIVVAAFAAYGNWLLAGFHVVDGQRFIRYRDLMGFVFGRQMYYITWILQFLTLILANMGFILLGARALKEIDFELSASSPVRLQYFIMITGVMFLIFALVVPTISAMRAWLGLSAALTFIYIIFLLVILGKDGNSNKNRDYNTKGGEVVDKVFNAFCGISAILASNTCALLPEIQSTLRKPAVKNMRKALFLQYTVGLAVCYGVSIVGYWAYGSNVSDYLPKQLSGPKWVKVLINSMVFLQTIVSQHLFIAPVHEALDTKFLRVDDQKVMFSTGNLLRRFVLRALLFTANTLATAAFPFMGDFVNLFGSFTLLPLTLVFPNMIFIKVKGKTARTERKLWHWANIVVFSIVGLATTVSAVRLIVNNARTYHFFADN